MSGSSPASPQRYPLILSAFPKPNLLFTYECAIQAPPINILRTVSSPYLRLYCVDILVFPHLSIFCQAFLSSCFLKYVVVHVVADCRSAIPAISRIVSTVATYLSTKPIAAFRKSITPSVLFPYTESRVFYHIPYFWFFEYLRWLRQAYYSAWLFVSREVFLRSELYSLVFPL